MSGRRAADPRRGPDRGLLVAIAMPVLLAVSLLMVRASVSEPTPGTAASLAPLGAAALDCPGLDADPRPEAAPAVTTVGVSSLADPGAAGQAVATTSSDETPFVLVPGSVAAATDSTSPVSVRATGSLAPALLATRSVASPLAAVACASASTEQWFTGLGAGAEHSSVLELTNDESGPALAEITVYSAGGVVEVPMLRGLAVPATTTTRIDLSEVVPRRGTLGLRAEVTRGRLGIAVLDREDPLSGAVPSTEWLASQVSPTTSTTLLGLTRGPGARDVSLVNPGDDEVEATISVITKRATFAPEGLDAIRVAPASSTTVSLGDLLAEASSRGAVGLVIESTGPVSSSLRQATDDLSLVAPAVPISHPTALVLPAGRARILLTGGRTAGTVTVTTSDATGAQLGTSTIDLAPETAANVVLPKGTALVRLDPDALAGQVRGAVLIQKPGATVLPFTDLPRTSPVPVVRPGLP